MNKWPENTRGFTGTRYTYMGVGGVQLSTIPCVTMVNETTHSTMERNKNRKKSYQFSPGNIIRSHDFLLSYDCDFRKFFRLFLYIYQAMNRFKRSHQQEKVHVSCFSRFVGWRLDSYHGCCFVFPSRSHIGGLIHDEILKRILTTRYLP